MMIFINGVKTQIKNDINLEKILKANFSDSYAILSLISLCAIADNPDSVTLISYSPSDVPNPSTTI